MSLSLHLSFIKIFAMRPVTTFRQSSTESTHKIKILHFAPAICCAYPLLLIKDDKENYKRGNAC